MLKRIWLFGALIAVVAVAASLVGVSIASGKSQAATVTIWVDQNRAAPMKSIANNWAKTRGVTANVVTKGFGNIRSDLATVNAQDAPDVILGAHDWIGELSANGSIVPLFLKKTVKDAIPAYAIRAFQYAGKQYGLPVQLENIAMVMNTKLQKQAPKTWSDVEKSALKFQKKGGGRIGLAVQQGSGGDAYHMYPFFSGLCGYIFGRTKSGQYNTKNLGVANKTFLKNAPMISKWNKEKLVNSKVDYNTAQAAFTSNKALYWLTGPWALNAIRDAGVHFKIFQLPKISCNSVPFLGVQGVMVTKFASGHGVASAAKDFVTSYMAKVSPQYRLADANSRSPAVTAAIKKLKDPAIRQFGDASKGGVPMPNIPQMNSVWGDLGTAWVKSTKGAGASNPVSAFKTAAKNIKDKIAGG